MWSKFMPYTPQTMVGISMMATQACPRPGPRTPGRYGNIFCIVDLSDVSDRRAGPPNRAGVGARAFPDRPRTPEESAGRAHGRRAATRASRCPRFCSWATPASSPPQAHEVGLGRSRGGWAWMVLPCSGPGVMVRWLVRRRTMCHPKPPFPSLRSGVRSRGGAGLRSLTATFDRVGAGGEFQGVVATAVTQGVGGEFGDHQDQGFRHGGGRSRDEAVGESACGRAGSVDAVALSPRSTVATGGPK